jgi:hypothetical protein
VDLAKSWVHRHVALYRAGGDHALVPAKRGPKVPANLTSLDEETAMAWQAIRKERDEST